MRECMIMNCVSVGFGSIAIATACTITKSVFPFLAFIFVPRWSVHTDK